MTEIRVDVDLPHPPERVWRALTDPKVLPHWFLDADLRPVAGSRFTIRPRGEVGFDTEPIAGEVVDVEAPDRLVMRWRASQLHTVVTLTLRRTDEGCRFSLVQQGFVGPRGTLRRRVLQRTYATMFGPPLTAALDRLAAHERDRAVQARRRGGASRPAVGSGRRNDGRSFRRVPRQGAAGGGSPMTDGGAGGSAATAADTGFDTATRALAAGGTGGRRRTAVRRVPDGRAAVPGSRRGTAEAPSPAGPGLGPDGPTVALPRFPVRAGAHERRVPLAQRLRTIRHAVGRPLGRAARAVRQRAAAVRQWTATVRQWATEVPLGEGGNRRGPVAASAALLFLIATFTLLVDRATAPHPPAPPQIGGAGLEPGHANVPSRDQQTQPTPARGQPVGTAPAVPAPAGSTVAASPTASPAAAELTATYRTGREFVGGYQGIVTINNLSSTPLDGWTAVLTLPPLGLIVHDVRGAQAEQTAKEVRFTPVPATKLVPAGTSREFSFEVEGVGAPVACAVNGQPCSGVPG